MYEAGVFSSLTKLQCALVVLEQAKQVAMRPVFLKKGNKTIYHCEVEVELWPKEK